MIHISGEIPDPPELELDSNAFDQAPGQGWRKLAEEGDYLGAARLLDTYLDRKEDLETWQRIILLFHAGQMYAFAGYTADAIARFKASIYPSEPEDWNAYVGATIAFLQKDRDQLIQMRDEISKGPEFEGTIPNLDVVDRLIRNFDQCYAVAYMDRQGRPAG